MSLPLTSDERTRFNSLAQDNIDTTATDTEQPELTIPSWLPRHMEADYIARYGNPHNNMLRDTVDRRKKLLADIMALPEITQPTIRSTVEAHFGDDLNACIDSGDVPFFVGFFSQAHGVKPKKVPWWERHR